MPKVEVLADDCHTLGMNPALVQGMDDGIHRSKKSLDQL